MKVATVLYSEFLYVKKRGDLLGLIWYIGDGVVVCAYASLATCLSRKPFALTLFINTS